MKILLSLSRLICISVLLQCFLHWYGNNGLTGVTAISAEEDLTFTLLEQIALDEFRPRVMDILPHSYMKQDIYLIRWLRSRRLNVDQAVRMLKSNLEWRREQKMDTINDEDWTDMLLDFSYYNDNFDKQGRPVGSFNLEPWNFRRIALSGKMPRLIRYMNKMLEEATQAVVSRWENGDSVNVTNWKVLINLDGFSTIRHACPVCLPAWVAFMHSFEEHYPMFADAIININTPPTYQIIFNAIRPLFSPSTQRSVKYFGRDESVWMEYLDNEIDRDQRRIEFGGTLQD